MKTIETQVHIQAAPTKVWQTLMDFAAYPAWNPFIRRIAGMAQEGERLNVFIQPPGGTGMIFKPRVLRCKEDLEFRWKGHLLVPGLFDGEHYFQLTPAPNGGTHLLHGEVFSGVLLPFLGKALDKPLQGFHQMNEALKARCEMV